MKTIKNIIKFIISIFKNITWQEYAYSVMLYLLIAVPIFLVWNIVEIAILGYRNPNIRDSIIFLILTLFIYMYAYSKFNYKDFKSFMRYKKR